MEANVIISARQLLAEFLHIREQNYFDITVDMYL